MKCPLIAFAAALTLAVPAAAQFRDDPDPTETNVSGRTAETTILSWPTFSYRLARMMIAEYGQPSEIRDDAVVWNDNGPWKRTVVYRDPPSGRVFRRNKGRLEQSAAYRANPDALDRLAAFDRDVEVDLAEARITSRADSEADNFISLNLADEVLSGRKDPKEAASLRQKLEREAPAGKSSSYRDGLLFSAPERYADPESPD